MRVIKLLPYLLLVFASSATLPPACGTFTYADSTPTVGRLELGTDPVLPRTADAAKMTAWNGPEKKNCCLKAKCNNCLYVSELQDKKRLGLEDIRDLAILVPLSGRGRLRVTTASIEIFKKPTEPRGTAERLFATNTVCSHCNEDLAAPLSARGAAFRLKLDASAAAAAQPFFRPGNVVIVTLDAGSETPAVLTVFNQRDLKRGDVVFPR